MAPELLKNAESEECISARTASKLPASERVALGLELVEGQGHRGVYYKNIRNADAFLVVMIYSRASIMFISLIGAVSAFNTLLFSEQLSEATYLCQLHELLPSNDTHRNSKPIVYYCRFLHLSVLTNFIQLLLCFFALVWALNRRSNLFLLCYALLCTVLMLATLFLGALFAIDFDTALHQSIQFTLRDALSGEEPRLICRQMPTLDCLRKAETPYLQKDSNNLTLHRNERLSFCDASSEWIEAPITRCAAELSTALMAKMFLFWIVVEYMLLLSTGFILSAKLIANRRRRIKGLKEGKSSQMVDEEPTPTIEHATPIPPTDEKEDQEQSQSDLNKLNSNIV